MDVYGVKPVDSGVSYGAAQTAGQATGQAAVQAAQPAKQPDDKQDQGKVTENLQVQKELNRQELEDVTSEMNTIMKALDTDIHFAMHEKTKTLMVQVIDMKNNTVLKEFPSHEMLDVIAKIRDYVGALLDKKV